MNDSFSYALLCFTSLFTIVNPFSIMPVFLTMTISMTQAERNRVVLRASLVAFIALSLFVLAGDFLFRFFGISSNGFRIVGGFIIFRIGWDMLQARYTAIKLKQEEIKEYANDISITPLAIPMLCGPGAIANAIVLSQDAHTLPLKTILLIAGAAVYLISMFILRGSSRLMSYIGDTGNNVMMRLMGLILMVIAVECFVSGVQPILMNILNQVHVQG